MATTQSAVGEILVGLMETLAGRHRSEFPQLDIETDEQTGVMNIEGITSGNAVYFRFELNKLGQVNMWRVYPHTSFKFSYLFNAITLALKELNNGQ